MSNSPTCKTCKFFDIGDNRIEDMRMGSCSSPKFLLGYHVPDEKITSDSVLVEDDEGWGFCVGKDFGCIHHQPKFE